jgi:hypothetical protein
MRKLKPMEKLYVYSMIPFSIVHSFFKVVFMRREKNVLHPGKPLSGIKKSSVSRDIYI